MRRQLDETRRQLDEERQRRRELEGPTDSETPGDNEPRVPIRGGMDSSMEVAPINEADVTLRRLVQRIAMILQAEKIAIMFYDREKGELLGIPPAYGIDDDHLKIFRIRATHGISGKVFREGEPAIFHDTNTDPRTKEDPFGLLHVQNGITVPLVIEKRDEENRVIDRTTIGVLHAFNKRHGEDFNDEDVRLLERMARNVGSIIANLQMYREVVEEREELLQTFESLAAGLILVSPEGRLSQVNASARAIFGADADAIGKNYRDVLKNEAIEKIFLANQRGEETPKTEIHIALGGTDRIYEVQSAQVRNEEGRDLGIVAIFNDITEMKSIDKMKSSFVAMASHELRTPLTAIKGFSSTLLEGIDEDMYSKEDQREFLGIVVQECDRLRRLIDDLLNTSRIESGESLKPHYTRFELLPLLEKAVMVQQQASNKHKVTLKVHNELPDTIIGDQDKLDQILTNLLNNAIKYSPAGGDVIVHAKTEGKDILIGVQDQGLGIPKEHLIRVFERFHRVDNEDNRKIYGTGLGLFLVKHLVERVHLGQIWVESEVGVGSTFYVRIPVELDVEKAKSLND
ncbi:MAG: GAF domain-containing protein [Fimbriimonadaceae bacterium]|nr:GAF domain-containing protein [Fimbriimonadaceae bacterium]